MPTPPLDEPSIKVTLNLYTKDVELLKANAPHGMGWSAYLRELVHSMMKRIEEHKYER
jgi:hypothetical protein